MDALLSLLYFSNSINTPFPIRILLREANWSDHRPKFKATVNFNGKELLAASSVRAVNIYIRYKVYISSWGILKLYFLCRLKIFRVNSSVFSCMGIEFMVCNFLQFFVFLVVAVGLLAIEKSSEIRVRKITPICDYFYQSYIKLRLYNFKEIRGRMFPPSLCRLALWRRNVSRFIVFE